MIITTELILPLKIPLSLEVAGFRVTPKIRFIETCRTAKLAVSIERPTSHLSSAK